MRGVKREIGAMVWDGEIGLSGLDLVGLDPGLVRALCDRVEGALPVEGSPTSVSIGEALFVPYGRERGEGGAGVPDGIVAGRVLDAGGTTILLDGIALQSASGAESLRNVLSTLRLVEADSPECRAGFLRAFLLPFGMAFAPGGGVFGVGPLPAPASREDAVSGERETSAASALAIARRVEWLAGKGWECRIPGSRSIVWDSSGIAPRIVPDRAFLWRTADDSAASRCPAGLSEMLLCSVRGPQALPQR